MKPKLAWVAALTLVASLVPDVLVLETAGSLPRSWLPAKAALLLASALALRGRRPLGAYGLVLAVVVGMQEVMLRAGTSAWWAAQFPSGSFATAFGGSIALKVLTAVPIDLLDDRAARG